MNNEWNQLAIEAKNLGIDFESCLPENMSCLRILIMNKKSDISAHEASAKIKKIIDSKKEQRSESLN